jgi:transcriptional antiterminator RfaH
MPDPYWAVARTLPNHDRLAAECIARSFEIFVPKVRTRFGATPLFPCYLFIRIVDRWRVIERTMGVLSLIKFGDKPAKCPDNEIALLLARADPDGIIRLGPRRSLNGTRSTLAPGATVTVTGGPLAGFDGLYQGQGAHDRERVLLTMLGAQRPVEIAAGLLAAR